MSLDEVKQNVKKGVVNESEDELAKRSDFFDVCIREVGKKVAGEKKTIKTIALISCGRLVKNAETTSFNAAINSVSGTGKDYVAKNTLKLFVPKQKLLHRSRITPTVLNYWHDEESEPDWTWDEKVLYLEDITNEILNSPVLKTFLSGGSETTITVKQQAKDIKINGTPVFICTFANSVPSEENLRRIQLIPMDASPAQTQAIKNFQVTTAYNGKLPEYDPLIIKSIESLERVTVRIPKQILDKIKDYFSNDVIVRTSMGRFFDYIKASIAFHQKQREQDDEGYYFLDEQDYELAREVFEYTTYDRSTVPVTANQKRIISVINDLGGNNVTVSEIGNKASFITESGLYRALHALALQRILKKEKVERNSGSVDRPYIREIEVYSLIENEKFSLPSFKEILASEGSTGSEGLVTEAPEPTEVEKMK